MQAWSAFYPDVLPEVRLAPLPMVNHAILNACIDFCDRSRALVATLDLMDAVADQQRYLLSLEAGTDLVEIRAVWFSGEKLTPKSEAFLERKYQDWTEEIGDPEFFLGQDTESVLLVPAPSASATGAIKVRAAIKPAKSATGIDDWLFSKHREAIAAGAKAALMSLVDKPWTNPDRASVLLAVFEDAIAKAEASANGGMVRSRPRFSGSFC